MKINGIRFHIQDGHLCARVSISDQRDIAVLVEGLDELTAYVRSRLPFPLRLFANRLIITVQQGNTND